LLSRFDLSVLLLARGGFDSLVVLQKVVFVYHVLEVLLDFFKVYLLVLAGLRVDFRKVCEVVVRHHFDLVKACLLPSLILDRHADRASLVRHIHCPLHARELARVHHLIHGVFVAAPGATDVCCVFLLVLCQYSTGRLVPSSALTPASLRLERVVDVALHFAQLRLDPFVKILFKLLHEEVRVFSVAL
jgi:hypothetical protein